MKNNRIFCAHGLTLFELLTVMGIVAILSVLAVPSILNALQRAEARQVQYAIPDTLRQARAHALSMRTRLGVCGSSGGLVCDRQWSQGLLTFADRNQDSLLQPDEPLIAFLPLHLRYGQLTWRSAGSRDLIIYQAANGLPLGSNGSLIYCPSDQVPQHARQVILSMMGHADGSRDRNGDGIYEGSDGQPINCA